MDQKKDTEPFLPNTFDGEEFDAKEPAQQNQIIVTGQQDEGIGHNGDQQINFYPKNFVNFNENVAGSSDDADDVGQPVNHKDQIDQLQAKDKFET